MATRSIPWTLLAKDALTQRLTCSPTPCLTAWLIGIDVALSWDAASQRDGRTRPTSMSSWARALGYRKEANLRPRLDELLEACLDGRSLLVADDPPGAWTWIGPAIRVDDGVRVPRDLVRRILARCAGVANHEPAAAASALYIHLLAHGFADQEVVVAASVFAGLLGIDRQRVTAATRVLSDARLATIVPQPRGTVVRIVPLSDGGGQSFEAGGDLVALRASLRAEILAEVRAEFGVAKANQVAPRIPADARGASGVCGNTDTRIPARAVPRGPTCGNTAPRNPSVPSSAECTAKVSGDIGGAVFPHETAPCVNTGTVEEDGDSKEGEEEGPTSASTGPRHTQANQATNPQHYAHPDREADHPVQQAVDVSDAWWSAASEYLVRSTPHDRAIVAAICGGYLDERTMQRISIRFRPACALDVILGAILDASLGSAIARGLQKRLAAADVWRRHLVSVIDERTVTPLAAKEWLQQVTCPWRIRAAGLLQAVELARELLHEPVIYARHVTAQKALILGRIAPEHQFRVERRTTGAIVGGTW